VVLNGENVQAAGIIRAATNGPAPGRPRRGHGETVATKRQVERKLRELIQRMDGADDHVRGSLADALPDAKIVELTVVDLPATYWTTLTDGRMHDLHVGPADKADIRVRLGSDHLVDLVDGKASLFSSFLAGSIKIDASVWDLLRLRGLA
jgi:hypothetical protein